MAKKKWSDLSGAQRASIVATGIVQVTLLAVALADLRRRPADEVNGSKWLWTLALFVNWIGPISYFLFGRKRQAAQMT